MQESEKYLKKVVELPLDKIKPDPEQPRQRFNEDTIQSLASSFSEVGQLQPVIVRAEEDSYLLVVGERRWRAARKAGQEAITACILKEDGESLLSQIQLIENIQREDLNPLERAHAIKKYMNERELSKKETSRKLGVPRSTLTEWLNITEVEPRYQDEVIDNFYGGSSPLTVSHISLALTLEAKTGDPTKKNELMDHILEHKLSRDETRRVLELYERYFNLPVEEAVQLICLSRKELPQDRENECQQDQKGIIGPGLRNFRKGIKMMKEANQCLTEALENTIDIQGEVDERTLEIVLTFYKNIENLLQDIFGLSEDKVKKMLEDHKQK